MPHDRSRLGYCDHAAQRGKGLCRYTQIRTPAIGRTMGFAARTMGLCLAQDAALARGAGPDRRAAILILQTRATLRGGAHAYGAIVLGRPGALYGAKHGDTTWGE